MNLPGVPLGSTAGVSDDVVRNFSFGIYAEISQTISARIPPIFSEILTVFFFRNFNSDSSNGSSTKDSRRDVSRNSYRDVSSDLINEIVSPRNMH